MANSHGFFAFFLGFGLLIVGLGFLGLGGWNGYHTWDRVSSESTVTGKVISLRLGSETHTTKRQPNGTRVKKAYVPEVEYEVDGVKHRILGSISSNPPSYTVGDQVSVRFPPDHPDQGHLNTFFENWILTLIFSTVGFFASVIGYGIVRPSRWVSPQN